MKAVLGDVTIIFFNEDLDLERVKKTFLDSEIFFNDIDGKYWSFDFKVDGVWFESKIVNMNKITLNQIAEKDYLESVKIRYLHPGCIGAKIPKKYLQDKEKAREYCYNYLASLSKEELVKGFIMVNEPNIFDGIFGDESPWVEAVELPEKNYELVVETELWHKYLEPDALYEKKLKKYILTLDSSFIRDAQILISDPEEDPDIWHDDEGWECTTDVTKILFVTEAENEEDAYEKYKKLKLEEIEFNKKAGININIYIYKKENINFIDF